MTRPTPGFTLVELLVVIAILGVLATIVTQNLLPETDRAKIEAARTECATYEAAVSRFYLRHHRLPEGLQELFEKRFIRGTLKPDPWDHDYAIEPGEQPSDFVIVSCGPDGQRDTDDDIRHPN